MGGETVAIRIIISNSEPGEPADCLGVLDEERDGELVEQVLERLDQRQKASLGRALTRLRAPAGRHLRPLDSGPAA